MTLTRGMIDKLRFPGRMAIDDELEAQLLRQFGTEPYPYEYSEQDIYEQVRKMIRRYNEQKGEVSTAF